MIMEKCCENCAKSLVECGSDWCRGNKYPRFMPKGLPIQKILAKLKKSMLTNGWANDNVKKVILTLLGNAEHYSQILGFDKRELVECWEAARDYSAPNYYKKSRINKNNMIFETQAEFKRMFPSGKYICTQCGGITTDPTRCNSGKKAKTKSGICDWSTYGLFGPAGPCLNYIIKNGSPYKMKCRTIFLPVELGK
jgi:hypothetical protein